MLNLLLSFDTECESSSLWMHLPLNCTVATIAAQKKNGSCCSSIMRMAHRCGSLPINGFEAVVTMALLDALKLLSYSYYA